MPPELELRSQNKTDYELDVSPQGPLPQQPKNVRLAQLN